MIDKIIATEEKAMSGTMDNYDVALYMEVTCRVGHLEQQGKIKMVMPNNEETDTVEDLFEIVDGIHDEWNANVQTPNYFKSVEEEGYFCVFAERVIAERYAI